MIYFIGGDSKIAAVDLSKLVSVGPVKPYNKIWNTRFTYYPEGIPEGVCIESGSCCKNIDVAKEHAALLDAWSIYKLKEQSWRDC